MKKIAVTGHRPNKLMPTGERWGLTHPLVNDYGQKIRRELLKQAGFDDKAKRWIHKTPVTLISGMAIGIDTISAMVIIKLKEQFPELFFLECAIPCINQDDRWSDGDRIRYHEILQKADVLTYVSGESYSHGCMQRRNEYMVDQADVIMAVWDGSKSGTGNCVVYALEQGKPISLIEPITLKTGAL